MPFENKTNHSRVEKAADFIKLIGESAKSNGASEDEVWDMLTPLIQTIQTLVEVDAQKPSDSYEKHYNSVREQLSQAYGLVNGAMEDLNEGLPVDALEKLKEIMTS